MNRVRVLLYPDATKSRAVSARLNEVKGLINYFVRETSAELNLMLDVSDDEYNAFVRDQVSFGVPPSVKPHLVPPSISWPSVMASKIEKSISKAFPRYADVILNSLLFVFVFSLLDILWLMDCRRIAAGIFESIEPDCLLIQRDRNVGVSMSLVRHMKKRKRLVFIVPWGFVNHSYSIRNRWQSARNWLDGRQVSIVQVLMNLLFPDQIIEGGARRYTFFKAGRFIAAYFMGVLPRKPWVFGENAHYCLVDSLGTKSKLGEFGVDENRVAVVGDAIHDEFYLTSEEKLKVVEGLRHSYCVPVERKVLILALPHLKEHSLASEEQHWRDISQIIGTVLKFTSYKVLVSLHPRCRRSEYVFLEDEFDVRILSEPLSKVISACDAFMCQWSGTTAWSVLAGKPTIVLDWWGVGSEGYEHLLAHVLVSKSAGDLFRSIDNGLKQTNAMDVDRKNLPPFDGKSTERIVEFILRHTLRSGSYLEHIGVDSSKGWIEKSSI